MDEDMDDIRQEMATFDPEEMHQLITGAQTFRKMYVAYRIAGFTSGEACQMLAHLLAQRMKDNDEEEQRRGKKG